MYMDREKQKLKTIIIDRLVMNNPPPKLREYIDTKLNPLDLAKLQLLSRQLESNAGWINQMKQRDMDMIREFDSYKLDPKIKGKIEYTIILLSIIHIINFILFAYDETVISEQKQRIQENDKIIKQLTADLLKKSNELDLLKKQHDLMIQNGTVAERQISDLKMKINEYEQSIAKQQEHIDYLIKTNTKLNIEHTGTKTLLNTREIDINELKEATMKLEKENSISNAEITELLSRSEKCEQSNNVLTKQYNMLRDEHDNDKIQAADISSKLWRCTGELEHTKSELKKIMGDFDGSIKMIYNADDTNMELISNKNYLIKFLGSFRSRISNIVDLIKTL